MAGKTCVAAYQPKGAASYAASKINLANPGTYNAYEGAAPSWNSATGWTFSWNEYLANGLSVSNGYTLLVRADFSMNNYYMNGPDSFRVSATSSGVKAVASNYIEVTCSRPILFGIGGNNLYADGAVVSSGLNGTGISGQFTMGHYNNLQAVAIYSDTLSAAEVATVSAAMAAL